MFCNTNRTAYLPGFYLRVVKPADGWTYSGVVLLLLLVGTVAALIPARRAAAVEPMTLFERRRDHGAESNTGQHESFCRAIKLEISFNQQRAIACEHVALAAACG